MPASRAREAPLVVGVTEGGDHLPLDEEAAGGAALAEVLLVAFRAVVVSVARKEPALGKALLATWGGAG